MHMEKGSVPERLQRLREKEGIVSQLTEEDLSTLAQNSEEVRCAKGDHLLDPSKEKDYLYLVLAGEVTVSLRVPRDQDHVLDEIRPGGLIGEMSLFIGGDRTATAHVTQDGSLLKIAIADFRQLLLSRLDLWNYVANLVQVRLRRLKLVTHLTGFFEQTNVFDGRLVRELEPDLKWVTLRRGERLFREGEAADAAVVVILGRSRERALGRLDPEDTPCSNTTAATVERRRWERIVEIRYSFRRPSGERDRQRRVHKPQQPRQLASNPYVFQHCVDTA